MYPYKNYFKSLRTGAEAKFRPFVDALVNIAITIYAIDGSFLSNCTFYTPQYSLPARKKCSLIKNDSSVAKALLTTYGSSFADLFALFWYCCWICLFKSLLRQQYAISFRILQILRFSLTSYNVM